MKILHLGYSDTKGGAAISMMRLHKSLVDLNIDSKVLVAEKLSNDPNVIGPSKSSEVIASEIKKILIRQKKYIYKGNDLYSHSVNFFRSNIVKKINEINPDIINLHWVNNELLSINQIGEIKQPIVWTFVDMWPMCGGEHYTNTNRFKTGYNKDNKDNVKDKIDLDRWLWLKKKKNWSFKIRHIICISEWLKDSAAQSFLFKDSNISKINCHIDLKVWKPIEKKVARSILDLPNDKKFFLFVSTNGTKDLRKGFNFIDQSLNNLSKIDNNFELLILGNAKNLGKKAYNYRIIDKTLDGNPTELRLIYSACDLILAPSTLEAFGQIALEGAACGIPTVAFKETGLTDIIEHKVNGYLSNYLEQDDFDKGLEWTINELDINSDKMFKNCLKIIEQKFGDNYVTKQYIDLYNSINQ